MPDTLATAQVEDFLDDLERALRRLPRSRRREIVAEIRAHIEAAVVDAEAAGIARPDAVEKVLGHLGHPDEIAAAAAAEEPSSNRTGPSVRDTITLFLLLVGGVVVPFLGWAVGVVLLWVSETWRMRDKLIGTLIVPGGLLLPVVLSLVVSASSSETDCTGIVSAPGGAGASHCVTTGGSGSNVVGIVVLAVCVLGPLFSFGWLLRQSRRPR